MLDFLSGWSDRQIGVDIGSGTVRLSLPPHESILSEPNLVIRNTRSGRIVAVGQEAADLQGRTPDHFEIIRPAVSGRIENPDAAYSLLSQLLYTHRTITEAVLGQQFLVAIPPQLEEVDLRTFVEVFDRLGARSVGTASAPLAALVGVGVAVDDPLAQLVVDIGRDSTAVGVVSGSSLIKEDICSIAGNSIADAVREFLEDEFSLRISRLQAQEITHTLAAVGPAEGREASMAVYGQDTASRLPREITVTTEDVRSAIQPTVQEITDFVQEFLQSVSADIAADVYTHGLHLVGGAARLPGLPAELESAVEVSVYTYDEPGSAVISGLGEITERAGLQQSINSLDAYAAS